MNTVSQSLRQAGLLALLSGLAPLPGGLAEPVRLRVENFLVMPSTGPVVNVQVKNLTTDPVRAVVRVSWPEGWRTAPAEQTVELAPHATAQGAFTLERALDVAANRYPVVVEARVGNTTVTRTQLVVCATAPYLRPQIDGALDDWQDAAPIAFAAAGRPTTVMTCWNRRQFCVAVRAEQGRPAAMQLALAAERGDVPGRYEFVVVPPEQNGPARCYLLLRPGADLALTKETRALAGLECGEVQAQVTRTGAATHYEVAVPLTLVPELRPTPGRPFRFSLLVHEAEGSGLRDLGAVMNLWEDQRHPQSWCRWQGAAFGATLPWDSHIEFGFSSSIH
ncbi:MAG: hypothetical protein FJ387_10580 [Verrucomicrobia bacterium]|nr:hypothetical protein [Verrucomicrobiota bacterium]